MKIKDYKCKCGSDDFFFVKNGNSMGIYCSYCGKWRKWADKDERNLSMKQEQPTGHWVIFPPCFEEICMCSICKTKYKEAYQHRDICPSCGARMEC